MSQNTWNSYLFHPEKFYAMKLTFSVGRSKTCFRDATNIFYPITCNFRKNLHKCLKTLRRAKKCSSHQSRSICYRKNDHLTTPKRMILWESRLLTETKRSFFKIFNSFEKNSIYTGFIDVIVVYWNSKCTHILIYFMSRDLWYHHTITLRINERLE